jgi:hypothetical protein
VPAPPPALPEAARPDPSRLPSILGPRLDGDLPLAKLLFEVLVPAGRLTLEQAAPAAKADGLARAYANAAVPPAVTHAAAVLEDARRLVAELLPGGDQGCSWSVLHCSQHCPAIAS